jgi:hypothetical protein
MLILGVLVVIPGGYFLLRYLECSSDQERIRWAAATFISHREARAALQNTPQLRHLPVARPKDVSALMAAHPSCCDIVSRNAIDHSDDRKPWILDPFGYYVHVSDGSYSLYVYVPGKVNTDTAL